MDNITLIFIAVGLAMDSFAVSLTNGLVIRNLKLPKVLLIASVFGIFHVLMPLTGWLVGTGIDAYVKTFDHWVAFILLSFIGGKMIYESFENQEENTKTELKFWTLTGQAFATSIDAFALGVSFAVLDVHIVRPILVIGTATFLFSILGMQIGKLVGKKFGKSVEIFGGLVLIIIGLKILISDLFF